MIDVWHQAQMQKATPKHCCSVCNLILMTMRRFESQKNGVCEGFLEKPKEGGSGFLGFCRFTVDNGDTAPNVDAQNRRPWNNVNPTVNLQESKEHKMYRGSPQGLGYVHTDIVFLRGL
ncbi:hypothetical protein DVH24_004900 [Malus domestica]|uniref:Uncharacterized protein n=1 Tax=Malus domestica TaxID=3750 RepID=A0A498IBY4_MALDO|nr:hypothetical protein DVH24_004900 [Malus domestica]